jgi:hypothetical protein
MAVTVTVVSVTPQRVKLYINATPPDDPVLTQVIRTDAAGSAAVRMPSGAYGGLPISAPTYVSDYEYSLQTGGVPITYYVYTATAIVATVTLPPLTQHGVAYLTVPLYPASGLLLSAAGAPTDSIAVQYDQTSQGTSTVHPVVGRTDPLVVLGAAADPTGTLVIRCASLAAAQQLIGVLSSPAIFMLRQSDQVNLDFYFAVTSVSLAHSAEDWTTSPRPERRWDVSVSFASVASPPGILVPIGAWAYADLLAGYRDYLLVRAAFATYGDLLSNTPIR